MFSVHFPLASKQWFSFSKSYLNLFDECMHSWVTPGSRLHFLQRYVPDSLLDAAYSFYMDVFMNYYLISFILFTLMQSCTTTWLRLYFLRWSNHKSLLYLVHNFYVDTFLNHYLTSFTFFTWIYSGNVIWRRSQFLLDCILESLLDLVYIF